MIADIESNKITRSYMVLSFIILSVIIMSHCFSQSQTLTNLQVYNNKYNPNPSDSIILILNLIHFTLSVTPEPGFCEDQLLLENKSIQTHSEI